MKKLIARMFGYEASRAAHVPHDVEDECARPPEPKLALGAANWAPGYQQRPDSKAKSLIVEGWRFLPHSYAIVNQWQLLALSSRSDVAVKVIDAPLFASRWKPQDGLFEPKAELTLKSFENAKPDEAADVTLRISFPFDFSPSHSGLTAVFGTCEHQVIRKDQLPDLETYERLQRMPPPMDVKAVTPSNWSAEGFYRSGFRPEQVIIVPHGVDMETFHPMPGFRDQIRDKISLTADDFVFLSVGAMTGNKGIDLLLQAFAEICRKFPHARLILKGIDPLYKSKTFLAQSMKLLSPADRERVRERLIYFGDSFRHRKMAQLYQAADIYISPYRAEGFNIPVLEAAASGIPIICTGGGSTDDFVKERFARKIESTKRSMQYKEQEIFRLEPNLDHLIALMESAIEDHAWRREAAESGPLHVGANYTWDRVVDKLVRAVFH